MCPTINKTELVATLKNWGATIVRVADTSRLKGIETEPADLLDKFPRALSIAVGLSNGIMDEIKDRPTPLYSSHYSRVNALLDDLAVRATNILQQSGAQAIPIPASLVLDSQKWTSFISHKAVAIAAGVGWQGKSLLVVSPDFGPRLRLITVLTDAELEVDLPLKNSCGTCNECKDHCPAGAILGNNTMSHYAKRSDAVDLDRCVHQIRDVFGEIANTVPLICGVCIAVCPWGKKKTTLVKTIKFD
jgi:epoxyqueuosine reductase QueG